MERRLRKEKRLLLAVSEGLGLFNLYNHPADMVVVFAKSYYQNGNYWGQSASWGSGWTEKDLIVLEMRLIDAIYTSLKEKYERLLAGGLITLYDVEMEFTHHEQCLALMPRLYTLLDSWHKVYGAAVLGQTLTDLANDNQNVHTGPVNKQTRDNLALITESVVPAGQRTLDEILTCWLQHSKCMATLDIVYKDMLYWANVNSVVSEGDWLYRRTLRGLWARIKTFAPTVRSELIMRLWEECSESVEMCAQGHLSRLANVLAGFDQGIVGARSLQDEMAYISRLDISVTMKISQANTVMDELAVAEAERAAWLEAF